MTESVQLRDLTHFVKRVWWIPVVMAVVGVTMGITASTSVPAVHRSEATVLVGPTDGSITQTSTIRASEDLAAFYADMARRQVVLEPVVKRLDLPQSWAGLRNQVSAVVPDENLRIVTVTVTAMSQSRATAIADALVEELASLSSEDPSENSQAFINEQADALKAMIDERKADIAALEERAKATDDPDRKSELRREANIKKNRLIDWQRVYVDLASAEPTADAGGLQVIDEAAPVTNKDRAGLPRQAAFGGFVGVAVGILISWLMYRRRTGADAPAPGEDKTDGDGTASAAAAPPEEGATPGENDRPLFELAFLTPEFPGDSRFSPAPTNGNPARDTPLSSRQGYGRVAPGNGRAARTRTSIGSPSASHPRESRPTTIPQSNEDRETPLSSRQGYGRVSNGRVAGTRSATGDNRLPRDMRDE